MMYQFAVFSEICINSPDILLCESGGGDEFVVVGQ